MSDTFSCYDLHQSQSADWSSASTASWVDLGDQYTQQSPDSSGSQLDRLQLSSSITSSCDTSMSLSPDQLKAGDCPLHCAEDDVNNFTASPQNSDVSALSYQNPSYFGHAMTKNSQQELTAPAVTVELATVPCLAEVPTDCITETINVACYGRFGHINPSSSSTIFRIAAAYGFTPLMTEVGTSYFRRLATSNFVMLQVAANCPEFRPFVLSVEELPRGQTLKPLVGAVHANFLNDEAWLTLIHLTCIYLAAKVLEFVPCKQMLQTIMTHIYDYQIATQWVTQLELEVLDALDWRLGPVYSDSQKS